VHVQALLVLRLLNSWTPAVLVVKAAAAKEVQQPGEADGMGRWFTKNEGTPKPWISILKTKKKLMVWGFPVLRNR